MTGTTFSLKTVVSVKMRNETGDEVFVSTGAEAHHIDEDALTEKRMMLDTITTDWLKERTDAIGGAAFGAIPDADDDGDAEEEVEEDEAEEAEEEEDELTEEAINAMKKADLDALIEEHGLDIDPKMKLADKRAAIIEALLSEEEDEEEDEEAEEEEEDEEAEEGEEEEFEPYTSEELGKMKLAELDEIAADWSLTIKHKAGADLKAKKANVIKAILKHQEEHAEE